MVDKIGLKAIVAGTVTIIYILSASLALMKLISHQSNSYDGFIASPFLFLTGLGIFIARAESLLESDRGGAFALSKLTANEKNGLFLLYASIGYKLIGLAFMLIAIVITIATFFTGFNKP